MPGEPVQPEEPAPPVPVETVCGPRKPGPWARASASSGGEAPAQGPPAKVQRYKAPPDFKLEQAAAGPPQPASGAARPGCTGPATKVSSGTTSKGAAPKPKPPTLPVERAPQGDQASAAPPARLPAGMCAMQPPPAAAIAAPMAPAEPDKPGLQEAAAAAPTSQQLAAVAEAAKVLAAHGFALTEAQSVAVQAQKAAETAKASEVPKQWA
eukprot:3155991-Amphidinium_carterae.1